MGMAFAEETVSVTSFGRGNTKREAVEAAQRQAVEDALDATFPDIKTEIGRSTAATTSKVRRSTTISVEKVGENLYEAQVEALVSVSTSPEQKPWVAVLADSDQLDNALTVELVETVREKLTRSAQLFVDRNTGLEVRAALERLKSKNGNGSPISSDHGRAFAPAFLIVVSTDALKRSVDASGADYFEMKTKVEMIDIAGDGARRIRSMKSTMYGTPGLVSKAITLDAGNQVSKLVSEYVGQVASEASRSWVIEVPTARAKLRVGQRVTIHKKTRTSETLVSTGEVIGVRLSVVKIATEDILSKSQSYVVKPIESPSRHGIILDSDW